MRTGLRLGIFTITATDLLITNGSKLPFVIGKFYCRPLRFCGFTSTHDNTTRNLLIHDGFLLTDSKTVTGRRDL